MQYQPATNQAELQSHNKRTLSSWMTLPYKLFVSLFTTVFVLAGVMHLIKAHDPSFLFMGLLVCSFHLWDVMRWKKVTLAKDVLIVSNYLKTCEVNVSEIIKAKVSVWWLRSPRTITLSLKTSCLFGDKIVFIPGWLNGHAEDIVSELEKLRRSKLWES